MRWGAWSLPRPVGLSRRANLVLLAGASILSSRPFLDLLAAVGDRLAIAITSFLLYEFFSGGSLVGHYVGWGFFGYFIYAYISELYLSRYSGIVDARGFRVITAGLTVYIGIALSRMMDTVPNAGIFALFPSHIVGQGLSLFTGAAIGSLLFTGYILVWRGERMLTENSIHFQLVKKWFVDSEEFSRRLNSLPHPLQIIYIGIAELTTGLLYVAPCLLLGTTLSAMNFFSPVLEILVVVATIGSHIPGSRRLTALLPALPSNDIEFQISDKIANTLQNHKGFLTGLFSVLGLWGCGVLFFFTLILLISGTGVVSPVINLGYTYSFYELVLLWVIIGYLLIGPLCALYGLLYWIQQIKRLPSYATYWMAYWRGEEQTVPDTTVRRPPGLFIPASALLLLKSWFIWSGPNPDRPVVIFSFGLIWPVLAGVIAWSMSSSFSDKPQSLVHEGRDVATALILQWWSLGILGTVGLVRSGVEISFGTRAKQLLLFAFLIAGVTYLPEAFIYAERQKGIRSFIHVFSTGALIAVFLTILSTIVAIPPIVLLCFFMGILFLLIDSYLWEKTDIAEE
jgi:hypothetical protein